MFKANNEDTRTTGGWRGWRGGYGNLLLTIFLIINTCKRMVMTRIQISNHFNWFHAAGRILYLWFSEIFTIYRKKPVTWNGLSKSFLENRFNLLDSENQLTVLCNLFYFKTSVKSGGLLEISSNYRVGGNNTVNAVFSSVQSQVWYI